MNSELQVIIEHLSELKEDSDVSKRFKEKAERIITILHEPSQMAVQKAIFELEELTSSEVSSYHRTQVWDVIGMLAGIKN